MHGTKDAKKNMSFYREYLCVLCAFAAKNISFGILQKDPFESAGILT
jgi:hypothetical protein